MNYKKSHYKDLKMALPIIIKISAVLFFTAMLGFTIGLIYGKELINFLLK